MRKFTILSLALAMLTGFSVFAADDAKPKKGKISPELLKKYDKNNDGKIDKSDNLTKEERQAYKEEMKKGTSTPAPATPAPAAPAPAK